MDQLRRYSCTVKDKWGHGGECMEHSSKGRYVEYSSHKNVVEGLEARIRQLLISRKQFVEGENV